MKKYRAIDTGFGLELVKIQEPMFTQEYIIKATRFVVWTMVWFSALAFVVVNGMSK